MAAVGIPTALVAMLALLAGSPIFASSPDALALGITLDLLLTIPLLYFLIIRRSRIPNTTVVPVLLLSSALGYLILPDAHHGYLDLFRTWGAPLLEIVVVTLIALKVRGAVRRYRSKKDRTIDVVSALRRTCRELLPGRAAPIVATELAVVWYGVLHWKSVPVQDAEFTYHRRSGMPAILGAAVIIIGVEAFALHLLLALWSTTAAWVLTGLSIYTALQALGFAKSMSRRPIAFASDRLMLRYGMMSETEIPYAMIDSVEISRARHEDGGETRSLSPFGGMERDNVLIRLNHENELHGLYGFGTTYRNLTLHLDEPEAFVTCAESIIGRDS